MGDPSGGPLRALVFDVDGTLVDSERHGHRVAFNLAFEERDLPWRWDEETYGELLRVTGGQDRLHRYLSEQGLADDERAELVPALHRRKTEILSELVSEGRIEVRPGARRLLDEATEAGVALAVATTGSRGWVCPLLDRLVPGIRFDAVVTGDDVRHRKPDPEAFSRAVAEIGVTPNEAVAVEDSAEGLASATGAGLVAAVVVNDYTASHDLEAAALVVDGFGTPEAPAALVADRVGSGWDGVLDLGVLRRLLVTRPGAG